MKLQPLVSVIITTKNEGDHIRACIESIQKQTYQNIEIIVVDNKSTDQTVDIVKKLRVQIFQKGPERSAQRNFGARKAKGNILLFIDADMALENNVVQECVDLIANNKAQAVIIPERSVGEGFWSKCKALEREYYLDVDWMEAARCYKRTAYDEVSGYDENLTGPEDFDLHQQVLFRFGSRSISRVTAVIIHDEGHLEFWNQLVKKFRYGRDMVNYAQKSGNFHSVQQQASLLSRFKLYFRRPELLLRTPGLFFGMTILKFMELTALGIGALFGMFRKQIL